VQELRAFSACLVLTLFMPLEIQAQTLTGSMLAPVRDGFVAPEQSALRKTSDNKGSTDDTKQDEKAPSRIGQTPTYGIPPASGAAETGFDSLNRKLKKAKLYPGTPKPKIVGPGNPPPSSVKTTGKVAAPVAPAVAGTVVGQPPRRRLKPDDDPFGNVGFHTGTFLTKAAVEISGGYNSNPGRLSTQQGSSFYMVSPELLIASDWSRHSVIADLRGSFTGYDLTFPPTAGIASPVPTNIDRPDFTGKIDGRIDVDRDTRINSQLRLRVATDNPGSPNIQVGLSKYPLATTAGTTLGVERDFNRLQVSVNGLADRTTYQYSQLTDGSSTTNDDRNFNQTGGLSRVSYDLMPGVKPFGEVQGDTRIHDVNFDRSGYQRDSSGGYAKAGSTFEFSRLLTGEAAVGYALRKYQDPRLNDMKGLLTSASLIWTASGLTTVRLDATSSIDETTLPGVSGTISRDYTMQVDHAFRRWLIGTAKVGFGTSDYDGTRFDKRYFVEGDLIYKLSRTFHIKAQVRHDWLDSSLPGANSEATVVMLGIRVQR
jgi:hypothetical protein